MGTKKYADRRKRTKRDEISSSLVIRDFWTTLGIRLRTNLFPLKEALRGRKMGTSRVRECRVLSELRGGVDPAPGCGFAGMHTSVGKHHGRGVVIDARRGAGQVTGVAREGAFMAPVCQTSALLAGCT